MTVASSGLPLDLQAAWLCRVLASGRVSEGGSLTPDVLQRARIERVHLLLAHLAAEGGASTGVPPDAAAALAQELRIAAVLDAARTRELSRVLGALEAAACGPLVFKGAALAHTHYGRPWLRPRVDTDILVSALDRERAAQVFRELGYTRPALVSGRLVMYQEMFVRSEAGGLEHVFDLHWRVANPQVVSNVASYEDLRAGAVEVAAPPARLRVPCPADALVLACVHRAAHHHDAQDLLWLYDIHLLAKGLSPRAWDAFVARAEAGAVATLCARGLALAGARFGTDVPTVVTTALAASTRDEPSAVFLRGDLRPIDVLLSDLGALGARDRVRLVREVLAPPRSFMRETYGERAWLPWAYVRRVLGGAVKWVRRGKQTLP